MILDEAAIDREINQQVTEMKKISHEEKDVKHVEENPAWKACSQCGCKHTKKCQDSAPLALHVESKIIMQTSAELILQKRKA